MSADDFAEGFGPILPIEEVVQNATSREVQALSMFMREGFVVEKADPKANICATSERRYYHIPPIRAEEFFTMLDACRNSDKILHYAEPVLSAPCGIALEFAYKQATKTQILTPLMLQYMARRALELLYDLLDFDGAMDEDQEQFYAFVLRAPRITLVPAAEPYYKDSFRIIIPQIQVPARFRSFFAEEFLRANIIKAALDIRTKYTPVAPAPFGSDDYNSILVRSSILAPVHLYGSAPLGHEMMKVFCMAGISVGPMGMASVMINGVADIQNNQYTSPGGEVKDANMCYELSISHYIPQIDDRPTWLHKRQFMPNEDVQRRLDMVEEAALPDAEAAEGEDDETLNMLAMHDADTGYLKDIIAMLDVSYRADPDKRDSVVRVLASFGPTRQRPVAEWFLRHCPDFDGDFEAAWARAQMPQDPPVTLHTLKQWAAACSPAAFAARDEMSCDNILYRGILDNEGKIGHALVARILREVLGHKYAVDVCDDELNKRYYWYEFTCPGQDMEPGQVFKWRQEAKPDNVHIYIADILPRIYKRMYQRITQAHDAAADDDQKKYWYRIEKAFKCSREKLQDNGFQAGIIAQAEKRFRRRGFCKRLDSYENVIGVGNGVLVLGPRAKLIRGYHDYCVSKFTAVNYTPFDANAPKTAVLLRAIHDIFPEEDVFHYMLFHASTGLDARESANILLLLVGGGRNGKSFYAQMIMGALGQQYCGAGKSALLTSPVERGNEANSAQMQMRGKRYFYFDEFNKNESLNIARVKSMVSPGYQSGRDLHEKQTTFKNTCNPICLSNYDLIAETTDDGTWRRLGYYRNKVKFCEHPDPNNPYEKKVNHKFIDEIANDPEYQEAMLSILVKYNEVLHKKYGGDIKLVPCPTIARETETYRNRQDSLNRFISTMVVKCDGDTDADPLSLPQIAAKYMIWYSHNVRQGVQHLPSDIESQLENSQLAKYISLKDGVKFMPGFRVRAHDSDPILPGETRMGVAAGGHMASIFCSTPEYTIGLGCPNDEASAPEATSGDVNSESLQSDEYEDTWGYGSSATTDLADCGERPDNIS